MSVVHRTLIAALCVLLVVLTWLVMESAPESTAPAANSPRWIRTRAGWRRADLHPVLEPILAGPGLAQAPAAG